MNTCPDLISGFLVGDNTNLDAKVATAHDGWLWEQDARQGVSELAQMHHKKSAHIVLPCCTSPACAACGTAGSGDGHRAVTGLRN